MQYKVETPEAYLTALADDWRKVTLELLRNIILSNSANITEGINYKMLSYRDERGVLFHLNAQKNYVSLYVGDTKKVDIDGSLLKGLNIGKGCIRFTKSINVGNTQISEFIARAIYLWNEGEDIGC
jgi:uncharacterized protein YdhG (YjbR/CyaY superfamily)